jgi:hypothetical protein
VLNRPNLLAHQAVRFEAPVRVHSQAVIVVALFALLASPFAAAETPILRSNQELVAVPFIATSDDGNRLVCFAALAHWYSAELGAAEPGKSVTATLWFDVPTGEVSLLNAAGDRMAIESLWCETEGAGPKLRAPIPLARRAGAAPPPVDVTCAGENGLFACR